MDFSLLTKQGRERASQERKKEQMSELTRNLRQKSRLIDREVRQIEGEIKKTEAQLKRAGARKDMRSCKILAKEIINSRNKIEQMKIAQSQLKSIEIGMTPHAAMHNIIKNMESVTEVLSETNKEFDAPKLSATIQKFTTENMKLEMTQEMISDTMDNALGSDDLEEEADEKVDQLVQSIVKDLNLKLPSMPANELQINKAKASHTDEKVDDFISRLDAL